MVFHKNLIQIYGLICVLFIVSITCRPDIKSIRSLKKKKDKLLLPPFNFKPKSILGKKNKIKPKIKPSLLTLPLAPHKLPLLPPVLPIPLIPPLVPKPLLIPKLSLLPPLVPLPLLPPLMPLLPIPIISPPIFPKLPKLPEIIKPLKVPIIKDKFKLKDPIASKLKPIKLLESSLQKKKVKGKLLKLKKNGSLTAAQYKRFSKALL